MALTPFQQSADTSGQGFNAKVSALVGLGQAIKGSQVAKQQMQEQFRMQQELIQFRADTELERQVEYYDRVTGPAQRAQTQQQQQTQQMKLITDSQEAAVEQRKELIDDYSNEYRDLQDWNLYRPVFGIDTDENGLSHAVVRERTEDGTDLVEIDYQQYKGKADRYKQAADLFNKIQEGVEKNWFPESYPSGQEYRTGEGGMRVKRLTRNEAADIIQSARRDPQAAKMHADNLLRGEYDVASPVEIEGGSGSPDQSRPYTHGVAPYISTVREAMDRETGVVSFQYADAPGWFSGKLFGSAPERREMNVALNGTQSVKTITDNANTIASELYSIDFSLIPPDQQLREQIRYGDDEGLSGDEREVARRIKTLRDEGAGDKIDRLFSLYYGVPAAAREWKDRFAPRGTETIPDSELYPNFLTQEGPEKYFTLPDRDITAGMYYRQQLTFQ